jgi:hypothetical protein
MPLRPDPPFDRLLLAMKEDGEAVNYADEAGIVGDVTIRFRRKRGPVRSEKPCITLIMVTDTGPPADMGLNDWETVRILSVDAQADIEMPSEADDPTGLKILGRFLAAFVGAVKADGSRTRELCDWITEVDIDSEERAQVDDGRLARSLDLQYRVSSVDGNRLLAAGENA